MSDKDQFTFEDADDFSEALMGEKEKPPKFDLGDDDDFPETDLSAAFSEGEHEAETPVPDVVEEPSPKKAKGLFGMKKSDQPKKEKKPKKEKVPKPKKEKKAGGGSSNSRILLIVLLLVVVGGAGAYYFMGLGETTPSVPTVPVPAKKAAKTVALPPKPAQQPAPKAPAPTPAKAEAPEKTVVKAPVPPKPAPAPQAKVEEKTAPVKVVAPAPPKPAAQPVVEAKPQPATAAEPVKPVAAPVAEQPKTAPVKQPAAQVAVPAPKPAPTPAAASAAKPAAAPKPAPAVAKAPVTEKPAAAVAAPAATKPVAPVKQVAGGAYALDAGSYLLEANRKSLVAKIEKLGYEVLVTPVDATLDMTRLRLGTFSKTEVKEALDFARSIEPGSYSAPAGDNYVIYAGTFLKSGNVDKLKRRFLDEGIKVRLEPVQVVRTLSRIRFGSFATREDAAAAALEVEKSGVKAVVVKSK